MIPKSKKQLQLEIKSTTKKRQKKNLLQEIKIKIVDQTEVEDSKTEEVIKVLKLSRDKRR
jgi:hypothetical protein